MTSNQFRAALKRLDISQRGFARMLGMPERTIRRWALEEAAVPVAIAILLRVMMEGFVTAEDVKKASRP